MCTIVAVNVKDKGFFFRFVKLSSPNINNILLLGCLLTYSTVFLGTTDRVSPNLCKVRNRHGQKNSMLIPYALKSPLNVNADVFKGTVDSNFGLSLHLHPSSAFVAWQCDKYQN